MSDAPTELGEPFECVERSAIDTLGSLGPYLIAANDPPWSSIADLVPAPVTVVSAHDMEVAKLDREQPHAPGGRPGGQRGRAIGKADRQEQHRQKEQRAKGGQRHDQRRRRARSRDCWLGRT